MLGLNLSSKILPFGVSNHNPILLEMVNNKNWGPIPFRFNPLWANQTKFLRIVADSWSLLVTGSPFYVWEEKLRRLKKELKTWAKAIPSPSDKKSHAALELECHQAAMEDKIVDNIDIQAELKLHTNLHVSCRLESNWWRLKSRCKWLIKGDSNMSYFQSRLKEGKTSTACRKFKLRTDLSVASMKLRWKHQGTSVISSMPNLSWKMSSS